MKEVLVIDAQGFGQPMVAATAQIPNAWQTRGGANCPPRTACVGNRMKLQWLAQSPDGQQALEIMPGFN